MEKTKPHPLGTINVKITKTAGWLDKNNKAQTEK
jgi:hypothetical protein